MLGYPFRPLLQAVEAKGGAAAVAEVKRRAGVPQDRTYRMSEIYSDAECQRLLAAAGEAHEVPEEQLDAVTGLSGSGPAYFARFIEWLSAAGVQQGLQPQVAAALTVQTALGTALLLQQRAMAPDDLVQMVSSPGGTTVAGRGELEAGAVRGALERTVAAATDRSRELGRA